MNDIVTRMDRWAIEAGSVPASDLMDEAAKEIEWLRQNRNHWMRTAHAFDEHLATMRVALMEQPGGRCGPAMSRETVQCPYVAGDTTKYCTLTTFTLTDEERDVLREVRHGYADVDDVRCNEIAFVIDRLLERLYFAGGAYTEGVPAVGESKPAENSQPDHRNGCGESRAGSDVATAGEDAAKCTVKSEKLPERERVAAGESKPVAWVAFATDGIADHSMAVTIGKNVQEMITELKKRASPGYPGHISFTLTDAERTAIEAVIEDYEHDGEPASAGRVATLRGLLEKHNGGKP